MALLFEVPRELFAVGSGRLQIGGSDCWMSCNI